MKPLKSILPVVFLTFSLAPLAHAQFGSGIVYDPTQSAHAIQQIEQGSQSLQTAEQIYTSTYKTMTQVIAAYNLAYWGLRDYERIESKGGTNLRVRLDYEIKADVQKAIYRERKADPTRGMAEIKEQVAKQFDLPFVNGGIQIPDARIEYDLPREAGQDPSLDQDQGSRTGHEDIEVLTAAYHRGHLRSKAQAGFRNYASAADRSSLMAKIEDDSHLMENILEL